MKRHFIGISLFIALLSILSCKKQTTITDKDAELTITADTLRFDTVFTSVGSATQYFSIINTNVQKLTLSSIRLMGGENSAYRMIVDGIAAPQVSNVDINAGDSIFIFVSVTIDPTATDLPFVVEDSIQVSFNGNYKNIHLQTYGQNAHFIHKQFIDKDTTWNNTLPYVIFGGVQIAPNKTLTIEKGCRIFLHADAPFIVDGTLNVNGTLNQPVSFQGTRLDEVYRDLPSSWPGIYFRQTSQDNIIKYGIVKNAYQGVVSIGPSATPSPKLRLQECIIDNIYDAGIMSAGSAITAVNCLISNCGSNIVIHSGGKYDFTYCTIVSYDNKFISHKKPVLTLSNTDEAGNNYDLQALFKNCIVWAGGNNVAQEVFTPSNNTSLFDVTFDHVLYKAKESPTNIEFINSMANQDPAFDSVNTDKYYFDFRIGKNPSPAIGTGAAVAVSTDLDGRTRTGNADLGCYTKH